jgi:hypothetical protein
MMMLSITAHPIINSKPVNKLRPRAILRLLLDQSKASPRAREVQRANPNPEVDLQASLQSPTPNQEASPERRLLRKMPPLKMSTTSRVRKKQPRASPRARARVRARAEANHPAREERARARASQDPDHLQRERVPLVKRRSQRRRRVKAVNQAPDQRVREDPLQRERVLKREHRARAEADHQAKVPRARARASQEVDHHQKERVLRRSQLERRVTQKLQRANQASQDPDQRAEADQLHTRRVQQNLRLRFDQADTFLNFDVVIRIS